MTLSKKKLDTLQSEMHRLGIFEKDLIEKFILGSGKGGQKINKTASTVYLKHIPTGIEIKCQKERIQALNRYYARVDLCEKIKEILHQEKSKKRQEEEKIRRQKRRRSRRSQQKILAGKKHRSEIKHLREVPKE